ncbi:MAG TPA: ABC transporter permease [Candidatus Microbacterium pullistercoris]|nr:ABC transporter permease [Candidatus Microbacterium pullistercoris]
MTTAVTSPVTATRTSTSHVSFGSLLRAEWIGLTSLRGTYAALIVGFALILLPAAAFSLVYGIDFAGASTAEQQEMLAWIPPVRMLAVNGAMFSVVVATIVGASIFAKEHSTGSLRTQLSAAPRRLPMFTAKATVVTVATFIASLVAFALAFALGVVVYGAFEIPLALDDALVSVVVPIVGAALFTACTALFALGIAGLLRSETWTVTLVIAFLFVVPMILMSLPWAWGADVSDLLLGTTGQSLAFAANGLDPAYWTDLALTVGWAAIAFFGSAAMMNRRDA